MPETLHTKPARLLSLCVLSTLLGACAPQTVSVPASRLTPAQQVSGRDAARSVTVLRGDGTDSVGWAEAARRMAEADVVLMGEVHGHALGNAVQQEFFEDILTINPRAVLAMEFYERDDQVALDDYLTGITDRAAFEEAADRNEGNNPPAHMRMIDASKEAGRPVIAANAPRRYVRLARTDGFEVLRAMGPDQLALVDVPQNTPQGAYRERFKEAMGSMATHGGDEMIESFLRSQATWDATMAQSIVDGFEDGSPVVLVVGYFHAQFPSEPGSSELVDQLRARAGRDLDIVTCITLPATHEAVQDDDLNIADFVVYVGEPGE